MSFNSITLMGRCGKDAEVRTVQGGAKVAQFTLCTGNKYTTKEGKEIDDTAWHNLVCWKYAADTAERFAKKGAQLFVVGSVRYRKYTDNNGVEKSVTEILVDKIVPCGGQQTQPVPSQAPVQKTVKSTPLPTVDYDAPGDDLPF